MLMYMTPERISGRCCTPVVRSASHYKGLVDFFFFCSLSSGISILSCTSSTLFVLFKSRQARSTLKSKRSKQSFLLTPLILSHLCLSIQTVVMEKSMMCNIVLTVHFFCSCYNPVMSDHMVQKINAPHVGIVLRHYIWPLDVDDGFGFLTPPSNHPFRFFTMDI